MSEIVAIVEGPTEQTFVRGVLAAHLGRWGVSIWAVLSGKSRRQGGVRKWESARRDIERTLKEGRYCTTMFDFYAMPRDWPGREHAAGLSYEQRGSHVEESIVQDLAAYIGDTFDRRQFIPYVQVHEFEALVFADVGQLAELASTICGSSPAVLSKRFRAILENAGDPEAINDDYRTCPSRRIKDVVPAYRKAANGPIVAGRIGLNVLREKCRHFGDWLRKLEQVAVPDGAGPDQARGETGPDDTA